jgi:hypothetical protein
MGNRERKVKCPIAYKQCWVLLDKKSEPWLGCISSGRNEVLFSPCGTFIRELLFDAVWLVLKLMIPTLKPMVKYNLF